MSIGLLVRCWKAIKVTFTRNFEAELGPYFRLIYNILRHIEYAKFSADLVQDDKLKLVYSKILRSHLNSF